MGIEIGLIIGGLALASAATNVVGTAMAAGKAKEASNVSQRSHRKRKQAKKVELAQQQINSADSRRRAIREQNIRIARLAASAENTGTSGSSGQLGAEAAISTNFQNLIGTSLGETAANTAINKYLQSSADLDSEARQIQSDAAAIGAWTGAISGTFDSLSSGISNELQ